MRKPVFGASDQVRHKPGQNMARGLNFRIEEVEGSHYLCSENKGTDKLCSYCTTDLRLCFRICKSMFSHDAAHINNSSKTISAMRQNKPFDTFFKSTPFFMRYQPSKNNSQSLDRICQFNVWLIVTNSKTFVLL